MRFLIAVAVSAVSAFSFASAVIAPDEIVAASGVKVELGADGTVFVASSDPVEQVSSRPDFGVLCYPVISMLEPLAHKGSKKCLLGENPGEDLCRELSAELRVKADTPPCFIWHTVEDKQVPVENSIVFAEALAKHKIPHELHLFSFGSHGLGLNSKSFVRSNAGAWDDMLICWLLQNGFYEIKAGE